MLIGINVPSKELEGMNDAQMAALVKEALGRTKQMRWRALNALKKLEIMGVPREYAYRILTEKELGYIEALELGYLD